MKRLKYLVTCLDGKRIPLNSEQRGELQGDIPYWGANGIVDYLNDWLFDEPLVLLGEDGAPFFEPHKPVAFYVQGKVWVNNHAHVLRPTKVDAKFLAYALNFVDWSLFVEGTTRDKLTQGKMAEIPLPFPPPDEQQSIAAFLDRETARIDALIAKKQRLIELLAEKRTALIGHAVTKGLNPAVPMKSSGIEWLGQIPEHWTVLSARRVIRRIEQGWSPDADNRRANDDEWAVMRAGCVNSGQFDEQDHKALPSLVQPPGNLEIRSGDFLMSRACGSADLVGSVAIVQTCRPRLLLCDKLFRLHIRREIAEQDFVATSLSSRFVRFQLEGQLSGAEGLARNISQSSIRTLILCLPPLAEQLHILSTLRIQCGRIDRLCTTVADGLSRLREYRTALISAAVTGRIDVRTHPDGTTQGSNT